MAGLKKGRGAMLSRIANIMSKPTAEWPVIAAEESSIGRILGGFYIPLSLLAVITTILALGVLGIGADLLEQAGMSVTIGDTVVRAVTSFIFGLLTFYALTYLASIIAPSFEGKGSLVQAAKLFAYSSTPTLIAGILLPFLSASPLLLILLTFASIAYAIYLIYVGAGPVLDIPAEKLAGFTVVVLAIYIALGVVMYGVNSMIESLSLFA